MFPHRASSFIWKAERSTSLWWQQFYLLFPLLVVLAFGRRVTQTGPRLPAGVPPSAVLLLTFFFSFGYSYNMTSSNPAATFYGLPSRFWQARSHPDRALVAPGLTPD